MIIKLTLSYICPEISIVYTYFDQQMNNSTEAVAEKAYDDLGRLSVFIADAKIGEKDSQRESVQFTEEFEAIEYHPIGGIFVTMCNLKSMFTSDEERTRQTEQSLRAINVQVMKESNYSRHIRDYTVLEHLKQLAERIERWLLAV